MTRIRVRRFFVLLTLVVALCAAIAGAPAGAAPERKPLSPSEAAAAPVSSLGSCKDIHTLFPSAPDGVYPVLAGNHLLTVFCYDMGGTPRDYIELVRTGEEVNFSQYTAGGASPGTNVRTSFTKLRIDPATLTVDIGDLTFATSTGKLQHSSVTRGPGSPFVTSMPYGTAMSCTAQPNGVGDIDLQGTPFTVDDTFTVGGFASNGSATVSQNNQKVTLNGGGYCGWITSAPGLAQGYDPGPGKFQLELACAAPGAQSAPAGKQYCYPLS